MKIENLKPIMKWAGGKRQIIDDLITNMPTEYNTYFELFLGGGALLFELQPNKAVINDVNEELMNLYRTIKNNPIELIEKLKIHDKSNDKEYYYKIRRLDRQTDIYLSDIEKAARTLYMNRVCFNGLYRVNKKNQFNVPYGKYKNPKIVNDDLITIMNKYFNDNEIKMYSKDYKEFIELIKKNDFVYLDPPYDGTFTSYTNNGFGESEQKELAEFCNNLNKKGVKFLLSNNNTDLIRELYKQYDISIVHANRMINSDSNNRGQVAEVLVKNY